jgi:simple sugar transport system ATP-binding protein
VDLNEADLGEIMSGDATSTESSVIRMRGIVKRFGDLVANDHVDLDIRPGEVLGLLGENGAGKTTLMRILYGIYQADEGEIFIDGQPAEIASPADAIEHGIGMIHQKFMLVPTMTVAENIVLGREPHRAGFLDRKVAVDSVRELAEQYEIYVDPRAKVSQISLGEQQCTEILKALYREAEVLILDEPTTVLTPQQSKELFHTLRGMASRDQKVVFITHKLPEVFAVTDRVVVLRDGKVVGTFRTAETNERELAMAMVGRELKEVTPQASETGDTVLRIEHAYALGDEGGIALDDVSLSVSAGEILGIGGIGGNGQRELVEVVSGLRPLLEGVVAINGCHLNSCSPRFVRRLGTCFIPADRHNTGTIATLSVAENLILQEHDQPPFSRGGLLNHGQIRSHARELVKMYRIHCQGIAAETRTLSGGNLQKLVLARELSGSPQLIVAEYPTRGLDIAATEYVHSTLCEQRDRGAAVIAVFSDLDELLQLSDRIAIMYEGRIQGVLTRDEFDVERIGLMMAGASDKNGGAKAL